MDVSVSDIKSVNQAHNGTDIPIELTNITGTYINHLNEDCLLEIFSSLTPVDLCSLAGTCKRFEQITQRVFPKEIDLKFEDNGYRLSSSDHPNLCIDAVNVECFFKNFGSCLSKLTCDHWDDSFLDLIASHYDAITLKHLDISTNFQQNPDSFVHRWDSIYPNITGQLVVLVVTSSINVWIASTISKHIFPNLERFTFQREDGYFDIQGNRWYDHDEASNASHAISNEVFLKFFDRHTRLRTLKFTEEWLSPPSPRRSCLSDYQRSSSSEDSSDQFSEMLTRYFTYFIEKHSTELGELTLPNRSPHSIVMRTDPICDDDKYVYRRC